ncbi:MAG: ribonuclease E activity regulator RraA [Pseudomonadota bacterium]
MKTADLIDAYAVKLTLIHLPFRHFGAKQSFSGQAQTVKCYEDNTVIRAQLETPGEGRVLVVDAGGSTRIAVMGDMLAALAIQNGWAGAVLNGAIRDSADITAMDTLVFALGTTPVKSDKAGLGKAGGIIQLGGATITPESWVYGDADGVLVSAQKLI